MSTPNPFDQFDAQASPSANAFDQFDGQQAKPPAATQGGQSSAAPARRPNDPLSAALYEVTGPISEGIAGSIAGNARGLYDVVTGKGLDQAARDVQETEQKYQYHPRTVIGEGVQAALGKVGQGIEWVGDTFARGAEGIATGDPLAVGKRARLEKWMRGELPGVTEDDLRAEGIMPRAGGVNPAEHVALTQGGKAVAGLAAGEALGATANAVGRIARRAPYEVEAESTADRGGLPNPNRPQGDTGRPGPGGDTPPPGGTGRGAGGSTGGPGPAPEPRQLPYHPADPTIVPARVPSAPARTRAQSASGLRNGRMLDPVVIDGHTGQVIDHPALPPPERPTEAPEGGGAREGEASEHGGGAPPPEVPIDTPPIGDQGLPNPARAARAAILRRVGFTRARLSAVAGNALDAADDYWVTRVNQPAGAAAKTLVDAEWPTLVRHGQRTIAGVGGTHGMDEGALEARGQTLTAPADALRDSYKQRKKQLYDAAKERAATMAPTNLQGVDVVLDNPEFAEALGMRDQQGFIASAKRIMEFFRKQNPDGFKPDAADAVRKWFNQQWSHENAWAIRRITNAIDEDVARAAGEGDLYPAARALHAEEQQVLGERTGISRLFETDPENPDIRAISHEKAPGQALKLPLAQFRQLVDFYSDMPRGTPTAVRRTGQAALGELRAQFINELLEAGSPSVDEGAWSTPKVNAFLKKNNGKFEVLFRDLPEATQQIRDLISAGRILRINRGYPGASLQGENVFSTGVVVRSIQHAAGAAGTAAGLAATHGLEGGVIGAAAGEGLGNLATRGITRRQQMRRWNSRVVDLNDVAAPEPEQAPPTPRQPRGPRKPPGGAAPGAAPPDSAPDAGGPAPAGGGTPAAGPKPRPSRRRAQPAPSPAPASPTLANLDNAPPAPAPTTPAAPGAPPAPAGAAPAPSTPTLGAFPAQGYTRAGYDQAQLARELGADPRAVGDRALMLHKEAEKATQAGDEARAQALTAERDLLVDASLRSQRLPPRQPPAGPAPPGPSPSTPAAAGPTLADMAPPPGAAPPAAPGPTLADVTPPSGASKAGPVSPPAAQLRGPTLADVQPAAGAPPKAPNVADLLAASRKASAGTAAPPKPAAPANMPTPREVAEQGRAALGRDLTDDEVDRVVGSDKPPQGLTRRQYAEMQMVDAAARARLAGPSSPYEPQWLAYQQGRANISGAKPSAALEAARKELGPDADRETFLKWITEHTKKEREAGLKSATQRTQERKQLAGSLGVPTRVVTLDVMKLQDEVDAARETALDPGATADAKRQALEKAQDAERRRDELIAKNKEKKP